MNAELTQTELSALLEINDGVKAAYGAVGETLQEINVSNHFDQYVKLQERYLPCAR